MDFNDDLAFLIMKNKKETTTGETPNAAAQKSFRIPVSCLYKMKAELSIAHNNFPNASSTSNIDYFSPKIIKTFSSSGSLLTP